jgi:hypothetical protein
MTRPPQISVPQWENILRGGTKGERVLLLMANLADHQMVREVGVNRGPWVERFLKATGLGAGFPWCAATIAWCCDTLGIERPKSGAAAVRIWVSWAKKTGRIIPISEAKRGDLLFLLNRNLTGHIGVCQGVDGDQINSIEGNTSSGQRGSQRDGDGLYRRTRERSFWHGAIRL